MPIKIVAFYTTNTPYEQEAEEFKENLNKYSLDFKVYPVDNLHKWELNCAQKSRIVRQSLEDFSENILYLDIDARFLRTPTFEEIEKETPGFCYWSRTWKPADDRELLSGTIYLPNNCLSREVVDAWIAEQERNPTEWDQKTLQRVVDSQEYEYYNLELKWVYVEPFMKPLCSDPIIWHTQASRRLKNKV